MKNVGVISKMIEFNDNTESWKICQEFANSTRTPRICSKLTGYE